MRSDGEMTPEMAMAYRALGAPVSLPTELDSEIQFSHGPRPDGLFGPVAISRPWMEQCITTMTGRRPHEMEIQQLERLILDNNPEVLKALGLAKVLPVAQFDITPAKTPIGITPSKWKAECDEWAAIARELRAKGESTAFQVTEEQRRRMSVRGERPLTYEQILAEQAR